MRAVARFGFGRLGLNRLEAACVPENEASRRLLERAGFAHEGLARGYLKIDGRWRDHLCCSAASAATRHLSWPQTSAP